MTSVNLFSIIFLLATIIIINGFVLADDDDDDQHQKRFDGDKVFRLLPKNEAHLKFLKNLQQNSSPDDYDFWTEPPALDFVTNRHLNPVDVHVSAAAQLSFVAKLAAAKLPYTTIIKDVQKLIDDVNLESTKKDQRAGKLWRTSDGKTPRSITRRFADYDEIAVWLDQQCQYFPKIATCHTLGTSFENRTIRYIRLSLGAENNDKMTKKQAVFIEAGMHAREWLSPATAIFIIDRFLKSTNGSAVRKLLEALDWYVLPVANPDGYDFSRKRHRMWRKTRSVNRDVDSVACFGVDANRNFDFHWSRYGSSYARCSELFHGPSAFSEPETKAMADFILAHRRELLAFFSLHAYSQFWLLPYGHDLKDPPSDLEELTRVALIGTKALKRVSTSFNSDEFESEWQCGNSLTLLQYAVSGSSMDWVKAFANVTYSYALELRPRDDPGKQDHNGFIARESDIEKSGIEVLAGLSAAVNAILEKITQDDAKKVTPTGNLLVITTTQQPTNEAESVVSFTRKLNTAIGSLTTWLISVFRREN